MEVQTGYKGSTIGKYATIAEAVSALGENKWIAIIGEYTLEEDFTIPTGVFVDVANGGKLTIAQGVTLTVAANAKRLGVLEGGTLVNNGTILVKGQGSTKSESYVMVSGSLTGNALTVLSIIPKRGR